MYKKLANDINYVFDYGLPFSNNIRIAKCAGNEQDFLILQLSEINLEYKNNNLCSMDGFYTLYRGEINNNLANGKGTLIIAALNNVNEEFIKDENDIYYEPEYLEVETYVGKWVDGSLIDGKYETIIGIEGYYPSILSTKLYEFYFRDVLASEWNPGKLAVSASICYQGEFSQGKLPFFHGEGYLEINHESFWIRKILSDKGKMKFKGEFKNGSIVKGVYSGEYLDYNFVSDKYVKYQGEFSNWLFDGYGALEYNYSPGPSYFDGIKCKYEGQFKEGLMNGIGTVFLNDVSAAIKIVIIDGLFYDSMLMSFEKLTFNGIVNSLIGFCDHINSLKKASFFPNSSIYLINNMKFVLPQDIASIMTKGALCIDINAFETIVYKNYDDNWDGGTFKYVRGKIILDGEFKCFNEMTSKVWYEKWRYGYFVEATDNDFNLESWDIWDIFDTFFTEALSGGKELYKRFIAVSGASAVFGTNVVLSYIGINIITALLNSGKNLMKKMSDSNQKVKLLSTIEACINSINGDIEEIEIRKIELSEEQDYLERFNIVRYSGCRYIELLKKMNEEKINLQIKSYNEIHNILFSGIKPILDDTNTNQRMNKVLKVNFQKQQRNLDELYTILCEINHVEISESTSVPLRILLEQYDSLYREILDDLRQILVRVQDWANSIGE